ncbi:copia protein [Tanacetum coccineum]|uniref:Copia protein n=1 Tax=Tanacetum coccineum TaxID=301880 RepID=A0ABQ4XMG0_9ASTR
MTIIGIKWVFRNKLDENGIVSRNKARLVAQGYNQQEGIDYDKTYAPVARLESIRILLTYACALDFKLFQMDVKSAFLNGFINEEAPKTSHLEAVKRIFRYIKGTMHLGLWYPKRTGIETVVYADSDHAGDYVDRKSTSGICTFVGCYLTSWFSKKQPTVAISTTEAEYVSAGKACQQALWMKQALIDYDIRLDDVMIMCNNKGTIDLSKSLGACVFTDKCSFDELAYGVPRDGPYQTNTPSPDDIISYIRNDREGQLFNESYVLYDHVMNPLTAQQERKTRKDCGTRSGRHSTSSSFAFAQPSSSHLYDDDDDDGNDEGTSRASTPSPIRYVNSLTNKLRDEHRGGLRIIEKGLRNLWRNVKKKPSNPQPLQSHPSLDITLCLSPITPLDHILDNPSLPSPPQPQPPIMGHPFY